MPVEMMDTAAFQQLITQQAQFLKESLAGQQSANEANMLKMVEMMKALQADSRPQPRDKEGLTTKRAFSMLHHYTGKVEEYET